MPKALSFFSFCSIAMPAMLALGSPAAAEPDSCDSLVTVEWLASQLGEPDLVVLDATVITEPDENGGLRSVSGRGEYEAAHIPGAAFADLIEDLADTDSPHRMAVPEPHEFAAAMGRLGVGDHSRVVIYDSAGSMWAARVWWMLRWIGFDNAAILDGGLAAWKEAGESLSSETTDPLQRSLSVELRPGLIVDRQEVLASIDDESIALIDALPPEHYRGEFTLYDRPGHIAGAANVPVFSVLDDTGRFKSPVELKKLFEQPAKARNIHYCGGGIAASGTAFAMMRAGYDDVAVYTNSLQEWSKDPANPMEVAPAPTPDP